MIEYLVVVMLTFMDGSYVQYNDGKWAVAQGYEACTTEITKDVNEMKEMYKDGLPAKDGNGNIKPSTFISGCIVKEDTPKEK